MKNADLIVFILFVACLLGACSKPLNPDPVPLPPIVAPAAPCPAPIDLPIADITGAKIPPCLCMACDYCVCQKAAQCLPPEPPAAPVEPPVAVARPAAPVCAAPVHYQPSPRRPFLRGLFRRR